jgi:hypothetical protein
LSMSVTQPNSNFFGGPQTWTARDFSSPSDWLLSVSEKTRHEIKSAIAHAKQYCAEAAMLKREDFPLPSFAPTAAGIRRRLRDGSGFVVLRGLPLDDYAEDEVRFLYAGLGTHLGTSIRGSFCLSHCRSLESRHERPIRGLARFRR